MRCPAFVNWTRWANIPDDKSLLGDASQKNTKLHCFVSRNNVRVDSHLVHKLRVRMLTRIIISPKNGTCFFFVAGRCFNGIRFGGINEVTWRCAIGRFGRRIEWIEKKNRCSLCYHSRSYWRVAQECANCVGVTLQRIVSHMDKIIYHMESYRLMHITDWCTLCAILPFFFCYSSSNST